MTTITDEQMQALLSTTRTYTVIVLRAGPNRHIDGADPIIWEHGRRNMSLRADGLLSLICPVTDGGELAGVAISGLDPDETRRIMDDDPAVAAGIFVYDVHPCLSFSGDALPA